MNYEWLREYCLRKPGVTTDYQPEWEATRYFVGGKMFAMQGGDREGRPIFTMKLAPALSDFLRHQHPGDIVPGYYMNKIHWSSLYLEGNVPGETVRKMADKAYEAGLAALPKKKQREIREL
ncbi:MmcQ/YjbR family DNA-binding protein [Christensenella intestinihominis]|uniref:MmcQ/YjbR family DNA-binding protein n=1 Tax=Christensenella intestinihominis TaxID=1851429 RepID=UPI00082C0ED6|nr:MmcQ/YjbR family DNA-binding protein [Christensenella intestinihominis]